MDRVILHIDMNSCFASIECLHQPTIRTKPVAVGGDVEARHGIILAKNERAKRFGIQTGEAIWQARQKCPALVVVPPRYELYLRFSRLARAIYSDYSDQIEPFGIDEAWVDVTRSVGLFGDGEAIAQQIRKRVKFELGITVSIGVSFNKVFAKLGSDYKKPDAVTVFTRENFREKIWPLPVNDLLYVGRSFCRRLLDYNIHTIGELANADPSGLQRRFGKMGLILWAFANGEDLSPVSLAGEEAIIKSVGNSTTTPRDLTCDEDASMVFWMLADSVASRMRENGFLARTVQISLRDDGLFRFERQAKLPVSSCISSELHRAAMELLRQNYRWQQPLRSIGLRATDLTTGCEPQQLSMLEDNAKRAKLEQLEHSIDDIRRRYGHFSIGRAVTLSDNTLGNINPKEDHTIHPTGYFKAV